MPHSSSSLLRYVTRANGDASDHRGVLPDIPVAPTAEDRRAGGATRPSTGAGPWRSRPTLRSHWGSYESIGTVTYHSGLRAVANAVAALVPSTTQIARELLMRRNPAALAAVLLSVLSLAQSAKAQARPHVIQGRVTSDSGAAISAADVFVTIAPSAEIVSAKSDATGNYRLTIANATGEYILNISALGYRNFHQRVTIKPGDSVATVNAKLAVNVQQVAAVRVQAQRPRPPRSFGQETGAPGTDGTNKTIDGVVNALPPELAGNIDAMAGLVPGLSLTSGGFSAFGLGADANMKTLNGMNFSGDAVPRDMNTSTRFISSPWDPTRGGFSGALAG